MNRTLLFFIALLLLFTGAAIVYLATGTKSASSGSEEEIESGYVEPEKLLTEFEFTDQLAKPFGTKQLAGQIWLGSFFFADCPSICMQQNIEIAKLHKRFNQHGVKIVSITVAPDNDPPHKLLAYANRFSVDHDSWKFLTGRDLKYVIQVGADIFGLPAADETHTSELAVFDRDGKMHGTYNVMEGLEFAQCVKTIEGLLSGDSVGSAEEDDHQTLESDEAVEQHADDSDS